eukprot:TRINITY_DN18884_c0_g1_i1.p1 TRINITY_DN18884_c0_g1~~TRINITY_DN18884_c0_g1_i1.p1  ORF type:complete len:618 (+),score=71.75 TRINITY_DN18884_c0_g1_i1:244-2097(+)
MSLSPNPQKVWSNLVGLGSTGPVEIDRSMNTDEARDSTINEFLVPAFPLFAMRISDFLELEKLEPHNELRRRRLVVPIDFGSTSSSPRSAGIGTEGKQTTLPMINFVSHQWLGFDQADPDGVHLSTLQHVFRRVIAGQPIFKSTEDEASFYEGFNRTNRASLEKVCDLSGSSHKVRTAEHFRDTIASGWVWMDYISIPQLTPALSSDETDTIAEEQSLAINSIPAYCNRATNFWICAPSGVRHQGTGELCSYQTWMTRGWCRMEETSLSLAQFGDARVLHLTQPVNEPPRVTSVDLIDGLHHVQRSTAVLTGQFKCCMLNHEVVTADAGVGSVGARAVTRIPCDKVRLRKVLMKLHAFRTQNLRERVLADQRHRAVGSSVSGSLGHSLSTDRAFWELYHLSVKYSIIFSQGDPWDEIDPPELSSDEACEIFKQADLENYLTRLGLSWPQDPNDHASLLVMAGQAGHLAMLRYLVETLDYEVGATNVLGMSALICAARLGHMRMVEYICKATGPAHVNHRTHGLGLSAIGGASKGGHPRTVRLLLVHGASVVLRRNNGQTPLHEAAAGGHAECCEALLAAGSDFNAHDEEGRTAQDLAAANGHDEVVRAFRGFDPGAS